MFSTCIVLASIASLTCVESQFSFGLAGSSYIIRDLSHVDMTKSRARIFILNCGYAKWQRRA